MWKKGEKFHMEFEEPCRTISLYVTHTHTHTHTHTSTDAEGELKSLGTHSSKTLKEAIFCLKEDLEQDVTPEYHESDEKVAFPQIKKYFGSVWKPSVAFLLPTF